MSLSNEEARLFAYACRQEQVGDIEAKNVLSLPVVDARKVLEKLVVQALLEVAPSGSHWLLAGHLRERFTEFGKPLAGTSLVSDQARKSTASLVTDQAQPPAESRPARTGAAVMPPLMPQVQLKRTPLSGLTEIPQHSKRSRKRWLSQNSKCSVPWWTRLTVSCTVWS